MSMSIYIMKLHCFLVRARVDVERYRARSLNRTLNRARSLNRTLNRARFLNGTLIREEEQFRSRIRPHPWQGRPIDGKIGEDGEMILVFYARWSHMARALPNGSMVRG
jgi:hypothetical protein